MRAWVILASWGFATVLVACGGGGSGGGEASGGGGGGGAGSPPGPSTALPAFPVLQQSADFNLPTITPPPQRAAAAGTQAGQVLATPGGTAAAGLRVELLDASTPNAPRVLASGLTAADGSFSLSAASPGVAAAELWLRATLADGSTLRAFATGWTELTPGTEVAVSEFSRLRKAGAFSARALGTAELAAAQESLSLLWQGRGLTQPTSADVPALVAYLRFHAPWNDLLERLAGASPALGAGDVAGMMPVGGATTSATVVAGTTGSAGVQATFQTTCANGTADFLRSCDISSSTQQDLFERYIVRSTGMSLPPDSLASDPVSRLLNQIGEVAVLEFPHAVGTRVLYDNASIVLQTDTSWRGAARITRRTYPTSPVQALGGTVAAVRVVLDYEVAVLNTVTRQQFELLAREERWLSPAGGRVRAQFSAVLRNGTVLVRDAFSLVADSTSGSFFAAPVPPYAGVAAVQSLDLRYRHAVYSAARQRIYAAVATAGGQILELDPGNLSTLRSAGLPGVPGRLAVAADGSRLYAGLDGGQVLELSLPALTVTRQFSPPLDPYGQPYDRSYDMAVDPFDATRLLLLAGRSSVLSGSGAVLLFRDGLLVQRDAPRYNADNYGWGYYSPSSIAWATTRDEFFGGPVGGEVPIYRFRTGSGAALDVSTRSFLDFASLQDVGGQMLTWQGEVIDARSFATVRALDLTPFRLQGCQRLDTPSALCVIRGAVGYSPPYLAHFEHATGAFLGSYRPLITQVSNGCPEVGIREFSLGLDGVVLTPMGDGRVLAAALPANSGYCSLQVWTLRGYTP